MELTNGEGKKRDLLGRACVATEKVAAAYQQASGGMILAWHQGEQGKVLVSALDLHRHLRVFAGLRDACGETRGPGGAADERPRAAGRVCPCRRPCAC